MVNVKKADGRMEPYSREKVIRTCLRLRLEQREAEKVADEIESRLYEGMPTRRVLQMMYEHGQREKEHLGHMTDLREAIALMRPKPDFEQFVAIMMESEGYKVATNKVLNGACVDHEIDVIASSQQEVLYIEVKHHSQFHTFTGLDNFLEINSSFEDLMQGYLAHRHKYNFTKPMLVVNTKISDHARRYAACRGIGVIAWSVPDRNGLEHRIHHRRLYPVTVIKGVDKGAFERLGDVGVYTLRQLMDSDLRELSRASRVDVGLLKSMAEKARVIVGL
jgi:Holliday junction resolvase-like predicted endonuclease